LAAENLIERSIRSLMGLFPERRSGAREVESQSVARNALT